MSVAFTRWPDELARRYREAGYWNGTTLPTLLEQGRIRSGDGTAVVCGERHLRYSEIDGLSDRLAAALARRGIRHGDTALVQMPNVAEFYVVLFALLKMGVAPVNALRSHRGIELLGHALQIAPSLLIGVQDEPLFADQDLVGTLRGRCPSLALVLLLGGRDGQSLDRCLEEPVGNERLQATAPDRVAFFQLSGGSTGMPKLIPRTHDDYGYSVRRSAEICRLSPETRFLCALPAAHNYPLSSPGALGVFHAGGTVVLAPGPEAASCFAMIARHRVTMAALVPSAVSLWLDHAARSRARPHPTLSLIQVGGAPFPAHLARRVMPELGCRLQQLFGMAEGLVCYTGLDDDPERIVTTQGKPMSPADEIRILDRQGLPVAPGMPGLLLARGPYTIRGYYRSPDHNREAFDEDGFYVTGDLVRAEPDGSLCVVGRVKDQVNRGGEKIAAPEIEALLLRHEAVVAAAVLPVPDPLLGEKSCAFLVLRRPEEPMATLRPALRRFLRELGLAEFKLPDRMEAIAHMPLTPVGKIDKKALRAGVIPRDAENGART